MGSTPDTISGSDRPMMVLPPWARIRLEEIDRDLAEMRGMSDPPVTLIEALEQERKTIIDSRST